MIPNNIILIDIFFEINFPGRISLNRYLFNQMIKNVLNKKVQYVFIDSAFLKSNKYLIIVSVSEKYV